MPSGTLPFCFRDTLQSSKYKCKIYAILISYVYQWLVTCRMRGGLCCRVLYAVWLEIILAHSNTVIMRVTKRSQSLRFFHNWSVSNLVQQYYWAVTCSEVFPLLEIISLNQMKTNVKPRICNEYLGIANVTYTQKCSKMLFIKADTFIFDNQWYKYFFVSGYQEYLDKPWWYLIFDRVPTLKSRTTLLNSKLTSICKW